MTGQGQVRWNLDELLPSTSNFRSLATFGPGTLKPWLWPAAWNSRLREFVLAWKWFLAQGGGAVSGWGWLGVQVQSHPPPLEPPPPPNSNLWPQILWHLQGKERCSLYNGGRDNNTSAFKRWSWTRPSDQLNPQRRLSPQTCWCSRQDKRYLKCHRNKNSNYDHIL